MSDTAYGLTLTHPEMIATVEAIHDTLVRRVRWSTHPDPSFRDTCPIDMAQEVIDGLTNSYFKTLNALRDSHAEVVPEFLVMIHLSEDFMDLIAQVTLADSWDELELHPEHEDCEVCDTFART